MPLPYKSNISHPWVLNLMILPVISWCSSPLHTAHSLLNGALYQIKQLSVYMIIVLEGSAFFFSLTHLPLEHRHVTILQTLKNSYCYVGFAVYYHLLVFVCCNPDGMCVVCHLDNLFMMRLFCFLDWSGFSLTLLKHGCLKGSLQFTGRITLDFLVSHRHCDIAYSWALSVWRPKMAA